MTANSPCSQTKPQKTTSPYLLFYYYSFYLQLLDLHWYFPLISKINPGEKKKDKGTALRLLFFFLVKLAALHPASVCGTTVGVCILCSHSSPAHSVCETTQSNARSWESRSFCLRAAIAFTFTACVLSRVCMAWLRCYLCTGIFLTEAEMNSVNDEAGS